MIIIFVQTGNLSKHYFHTGNRTLKGKKIFFALGFISKTPSRSRNILRHYLPSPKFEGRQISNLTVPMIVH